MGTYDPHSEPPPKFDRPMEEIVSTFRHQQDDDDCYVCALGSVMEEFGQRLGFEFAPTRPLMKDLTGYTKGSGSRSQKVGVNTNQYLRRRGLNRSVAVKETQGSDSSIASLVAVCNDNRTSLPLVGVGPGYWKLQRHLDVKGTSDMDHVLIVLKASATEILYFCPASSPTSANSLHTMTTVDFSRIWKEVYIDPNWMLWLALSGETPPLEAWAGGRKQ